MSKIIKHQDDSLLTEANALKVGELLEMKSDPFDGHIIIRTYSGFVSLTNPQKTWTHGANLRGRKLLPGESITLIQE